MCVCTSVHVLCLTRVEHFFSIANCHQSREKVITIEPSSLILTSSPSGLISSSSLLVCVNEFTQKEDLLTGSRLYWILNWISEFAFE